MNHEGLGARVRIQVRVRGNRWLLVGAALTVWGITACAGPGGGTPGSPAASSSPGGASTASTAPGPPLSAEALKSIALTGEDVPDSLAVSADERSPADSDSTSPPVSDPSCETLLDATHAVGASAVVDQSITWKGSILPGGNTLASYEGTGAEKAIDRVRTSLTTCHDFTGDSRGGKYTSHVAPEKAPRLGDESIAFRVTTPVKQEAPDLPSGLPVPVQNQQHILVRVGGVTASFSRLDLGNSNHFPLALIRKEVARMTKAQHA